jgi:hypothetical protein
MEEKTKDYSKYEGMKVKVINSKDNKNDNDFIVEGCDYDIGITITKINDRKDHFLCLSGPSSPSFKDMFVNESQYKQFFSFVIKEIEAGVCDEKASRIKFKEIIKKCGFCSQANCAFSE